MTTLQKIGVGVVVILAILGAIGFVRTFGSSASFGSTTFQAGQVQETPFLFLNGFSAGSTQQLGVDASGNLNDASETSLGNITASSTVFTAAPSCFQFYATSTATVDHLTASSTATLLGQTGVMFFAYGKCT
jgi:hypothetical protein